MLADPAIPTGPTPPPTGETAWPTAERPGDRGRSVLRRLRLAAPALGQALSPRHLAVAAVAAAALLVLVPRADAVAGELVDAFWRAVNGDWRWAAAAIALETVSFLGYIGLFSAVAGRATERIRLRQSVQLTLAGTAATPLLPTAGLGGIALSLWTLRGAGLSPRAAARHLLAFLVLLYSPFMAVLVVVGLGLAGGVLAGGGPRSLELAAAGSGALVVALVLVFAAIGPGLRARLAPTTDVRAGRLAAARGAAAELRSSERRRGDRWRS